MKSLLIMTILVLYSFSTLADELEDTVRMVNQVLQTFENLEEAGYRRCDRASNVQGLADVLATNGEIMWTHVISEEYANEIFTFLANQEPIPFGYPNDGCYARAHAMSLLLERNFNIISGKVFLRGDLEVETENENGVINWWYHVAPIITVRDASGVDRLMVFDPSIFDRPVTVEQWREIQTSRTNDDDALLNFTTRFHYSPMGLDQEMYNYNQYDIEGTYSTMNQYYPLQEREGEDGE